jgi:hypothetical protein
MDLPQEILGQECETGLARMFDELTSRDHEDGRATGQPQGVSCEAYLKGTSQLLTPEDARKEDHIHGPPWADSSNIRARSV